MRPARWGAPAQDGRRQAADWAADWAADASGTRYYAHDVFGNVSQIAHSEPGSNAITTTQCFDFDDEDRLGSVYTASGKALALARDVEGRAQQVLGVVAGSGAQLVADTTYRSDGQADVTTLDTSVKLDKAFDSNGAPSGLKESGTDRSGGGRGGSDQGDVPIGDHALSLRSTCGLRDSTSMRKAGCITTGIGIAIRL